MLLRKINVQNAVRCFLQKRKVFATTVAPRFISSSREVNSNFVTNRQKKFSPTDLDQIPRRNKMTTISSSSQDPEVYEFTAAFPDLVGELVEIISRYDSNAIVSEWFAKTLHYNVPHGKMYRGLTTVSTYKQLVGKSQLTPENIRLAHYVAWCVEMLQATLLIYDDIMDGSSDRRGQSAWYCVEDVGMMSINDGLLIENGLYQILRKYCGHTEYYADLVDLFREAMFITAAAQCLDVRMSKMDVTHFTMDKYRTIADFKMSFYSLYFPVAAPMIMCGITDPEVHRQVKAILMEIGLYYQIQNDFWDCFGNPSVTGKIGTDIEENKCTWLAVKCMERASEDQKAIMKECHGQKDPEKVARVKELYKELEIPNTFAVYEKDSYDMIKRMIEKTSVGVPHAVFFKILDMIYLKNNPDMARGVRSLSL